MSNFLKSGNARETSTEIMEAILYVANGDEHQAARVWDEPTEPELLAIWECVTKNGRLESTDYCWGASGTRWAASIEMTETNKIESSFVAKFRGETLGYFPTADDAQAAIDAAEAAAQE